MNKLPKLMISAILMVFVIIPGISGCSNNKNNSSNSTSLAFQQAILAEINYARTNPSGYATKRLTSYNSAGTDNGAYDELQSRTAVDALKLQSPLNTAASDYAEYLAENNILSHNAKGTPSSRASAAGYSYSVGENIAAGSLEELNANSDPSGAAIAFVLMLVIDKGVSGVGHRNNILSSSYKKLGVGFSRNTYSTYVNYLVQDFGTQ
jgi:uncharacterized protein YkwD